MDNKPQPTEEMLLRLIASITDNDPLDKESIRKSLIEEGRNPDEVMKRWSDQIKGILSEAKKKQIKRNRGLRP